MPSKDLTYNLIGKDVSASAAIGKTGDAANEAGEKISGAFSKVGDAVGGEIGELVNKVGEGFEKMGESGSSTFGKIAAGGAVVAGIGVAIQTMTSSSVAAEQQLKAAVDTTGDSWDDYESQVKQADDTEAQYSHGAAETDSALQILVQATGSLKTALADMSVVTDLAAAKHISLADAATLVGKIYAGSSKTLKQFGIDLQVTAGNADEANAAVTALGNKVAGQAAAQADTFTGKIGAARTELENWGDETLAVAGGPLTALGGAVGLVTGLMEVGATVTELLKGKHVENAVATTAEAAADDKLAASADLASGANAKLADSEAAVAGRSGLASAGAFGLAGGLAAGAVAGGLLTDQLTGSLTQALVSTSSPMIGLGEDIAALSDKYVMAWKNGSQLTSVLNNSAKSTSAFAQALEADNGTVGDTTDKFALAQIQAHGLATALEKSGLSAGQLTAGLTGTNQEFGNTIKTLEQSGAVGKNTIQAFMELRKEFLDGQISAADYESGLVSLGLAADDLGPTFKELGVTTDKVSSDFNDGADAVKSYTSALDKLSGQNLDAQESQDKFQTSLNDLKTNLDKTTKSVQGNTDGAITNRDAVLDQITAINGIAQKQLQAGASTDSVNQTLAANEAALKKAAIANGLNAQQVQALIDKYAATPAQVNTQVNVDDAAAILAIDTIQGKVDYLAGVMSRNLNEGLGLVNSTDSQIASSSAANRANQMHASGGVIGGQTFDEDGIEALNLPDGTTVIPHGQTMQKYGSSPSPAGDTYHITVQVQGLVTGNSAQLGRAIGAHLENYVGSGGKVTIAKGVR